MIYGMEYINIIILGICFIFIICLMLDKKKGGANE
jgi:hypothetical protein